MKHSSNQKSVVPANGNIGTNFTQLVNPNVPRTEADSELLLLSREPDFGYFYSFARLPDTPPHPWNWPIPFGDNFVFESEGQDLLNIPHLIHSQVEIFRIRFLISGRYLTLTIAPIPNTGPHEVYSLGYGNRFVGVDEELQKFSLISIDSAFYLIMPSVRNSIVCVRYDTFNNEVLFASEFNVDQYRTGFYSAPYILPLGLAPYHPDHHAID